MVNRRRFLLTSLAGMLPAPLAAEAQQAGKVYRVGFLSNGWSTASRQFVAAFREGLRELAWVEGQNLVIEYRWAEGKSDRLPDLTAELVRLRVDVLVASGAAATRAAKEATTTTPIVSVGVQDPVALGSVQSLARPRGNITGPTLTGGLAIVGKQLELLKETVPGVSRVAVLWNPGNPMLLQQVREAEIAAGSLSVQLQPVEARSPDEFDRAFSMIIRGRMEALLVTADPMFGAQATRLATLAARNRLPAMYGLRRHVEAGGLIAYGASELDVFRRAATYVDRILKGTKPADLPMEQPTKFELVINLKTAKALGLTIPASVLARADEVIE
jgi:putative tryptophan/tyrosine transport system substrate-binding protein